MHPGRNRRALVPSSLIALLLGACAHATPPRPRAAEEVTVGDLTVVLRYDADDAAVAAQLRSALRAAVPLAQRWGALPSPLGVTVHPTHAALEAAARHPAHPWLRAWARLDSIELQSPRTWSRGAATDAELTQLLAHELTHCAMYAALGGEPRLAREIPAWFREGMATTNAGEHLEGFPAPALDTLTPDAAQYRDDAPLVYATADRAFRALERRYHRDRIREILARVRGGARFADAFRDALGVSLSGFEEELRGALVPAQTVG